MRNDAEAAVGIRSKIRFQNIQMSILGIRAGLRTRECFQTRRNLPDEFIIDSRAQHRYHAVTRPDLTVPVREARKPRVRGSTGATRRWLRLALNYSRVSSKRRGLGCTVKRCSRITSCCEFIDRAQCL